MGNNPVNFIDPYGLQKAPPFIPWPPLLFPPISPVHPPNQQLPLDVCLSGENLSSGGAYIEEDCRLIDKGPTVCIYQCDISGQIITRPPPLPGKPETCAPVILNRTKI